MCHLWTMFHCSKFYPEMVFVPDFTKGGFGTHLGSDCEKAQAMGN